uniref:Uncharacterized protein n=1 Tax=Arundo donax TaxID=35708 RepID=A0A0A9FV33_ARUDO
MSTLPSTLRHPMAYTLHMVAGHVKKGILEKSVCCSNHTLFFH